MPPVLGVASCCLSTSKSSSASCVHMVVQYPFPLPAALEALGSCKKHKLQIVSSVPCNVMQAQIATCQFSLYSNCKCTSSKIAGMMDDSFDKNLSKLAIAGFIQHKSFLAGYCWIQSTKNVSSAGIFHMVSHSLSLLLSILDLHQLDGWIHLHRLTSSCLHSVLFITTNANANFLWVTVNASSFSPAHTHLSVQKKNKSNRGVSSL